MNPKLLTMFKDPNQHEALADMLARLSAPPELPDTMPQQEGAVDFGALLAEGPAVRPTGPQPAPKPAPGVQWWKQPSDPRPVADAPMPVSPNGPPSRGFNPNKDREWRDDMQFLTDEEFINKWGMPKQ
ncbi:MAG: hypothetical protein ACYC1K_03340 [Minisyncoccota bacterium]